MHSAFSASHEWAPETSQKWRVGALVGAVVGSAVGEAVGAVVGAAVGNLVGVAVGTAVGLTVGGTCSRRRGEVRGMKGFEERVVHARAGGILRFSQRDRGAMQKRRSGLEGSIRDTGEGQLINVVPEQHSQTARCQQL